MVVLMRPETLLGTSLRSLVEGFVLTKQTEEKSPRTVEYYRDNLRRFFWYAEQKGWPDDARSSLNGKLEIFLPMLVAPPSAGD